MTDQERESLRAAVESLHGCKANFKSADTCQAPGKDPTAAREVATFALDGHPTAPLAYAWFDWTERRRHHRVVLHSGGITSAQVALLGFRLFHTGDTEPDRGAG